MSEELEGAPGGQFTNRATRQHVWLKLQQELMPEVIFYCHRASPYQGVFEVHPSHLVCRAEFLPLIPRSVSDQAFRWRAASMTTTRGDSRVLEATEQEIAVEREVLEPRWQACVTKLWESISRGYTKFLDVTRETRQLLPPTAEALATLESADIRDALVFIEGIAKMNLSRASVTIRENFLSNLKTEVQLLLNVGWAYEQVQGRPLEAAYNLDKLLVCRPGTVRAYSSFRTPVFPFPDVFLTAPEPPRPSVFVPGGK